MSMRFVMEIRKCDQRIALVYFRDSGYTARSLHEIACFVDHVAGNRRIYADTYGRHANMYSVRNEILYFYDMRGSGVNHEERNDIIKQFGDRIIIPFTKHISFSNSVYMSDEGMARIEKYKGINSVIDIDRRTITLNTYWKLYPEEIEPDSTVNVILCDVRSFSFDDLSYMEHAIYYTNQLNRAILCKGELLGLIQ